MPRPRPVLKRAGSEPSRRRARIRFRSCWRTGCCSTRRLGDQWTYGSRITYSFIPDGTAVGTYTSSLFQTLDNNYSPAVWQPQIEAGRIALGKRRAHQPRRCVSDDGAPVGAARATSRTTRVLRRHPHRRDSLVRRAPWP